MTGKTLAHLALAGFFALAVSGCVATMPANITAAVADPGRPAADTERDANRKPAEMLVFAGVKPGQVIVDLIPGRGYFTRPFSKATGPQGRVFAYVPTELDAIFKKNNVPVSTAPDPAYPNITVLHQPIQSFSTPVPVDLVWTSQNYHDLHDKFMGPIDLVRFNKAVFDAIKPGGLYVVLDHSALVGAPADVTETLHRIEEAVVKREVLAAGFVLVGASDVLRNPNDPRTANVFDPGIRGHTDQFILKFRKPR